MRFRTSLAVSALIALVAAPVFACRMLVQFPEHLTGVSPDWPDAYRVVTISESHADRIVGRIAMNIGSDAVKGQMITFYFRPDEEAHAVCATPFEIGKTYLVHSTVEGQRREISRFNWKNVPESHEKFSTYVRDLKTASAQPKAERHD